MERHLDDELKKFNNDLLQMATLTEEAIHKSIQALKKQDKHLAEKIIVEDQRIDNFENAIEEQTVELLALFQPMAVDLRFVTTGRRLSAELERIADMVVNICQRVIDIADEPLVKPLEDIPLLAENARKMVRMAIDAFVARDEDLAVEVILSDKESNRLRNAIMHELIHDYLVKDGTAAPRAIPLLLIARDLERISDHATAIAEDVIYMVRAKVVRHHPELLAEGEGQEQEGGASV